MIPPWSIFRRNYFINNYNAILSIDHDDGSNHYLDTLNVLMYSGQKNYIGWEKHAVQNLYIRPDLADSREEASSTEACEANSWEFACKKWNHCNGQASFEPMARYINNTCIYGTADVYSKPACDVYGATGSITSLAQGNTFMTPGAVATVQCTAPDVGTLPGGEIARVCKIPQHQNVRIDGDDIQPKRVASSADECCALCGTVESCRAFLWVKPTTCWLKTSAQRARHDPRCVAGMEHLSPPAPPHPAGGISLQQYTAMTRRDVGSVVVEMPSTSQIVEMAKELLNS